ncbi:hypothetical protein CHCC20375_1391 [Bacillus licheniformis]|nr:hypothetical protein CHCC20375_1391 [Bacillus licheniformis]
MFNQIYFAQSVIGGDRGYILRRKRMQHRKIALCYYQSSPDYWSDFTTNNG